MSKKHYDNTKTYIKNKCEKVIIDIANNQYTYNDVKYGVIVNYIFNEKIDWEILNKDYILYSINLLNSERFMNDSELVEIVCKRNKIDKLEQLFSINSDKKSLIYELIINKFVSPMFYVCALKQMPEVDFTSEDSIHRRFRYIINILRNEMKY